MPLASRESADVWGGRALQLRPARNDFRMDAKAGVFHLLLELDVDLLRLTDAARRDAAALGHVPRGHDGRDRPLPERRVLAEALRILRVEGDLRQQLPPIMV